MSRYPGSLLPELQALETKMRDPSVHTYPIHPANVFYSLSSTGSSQSITAAGADRASLFLFLHTIPCAPLETAAYFLACYKISSLVQKAPVQLCDFGRHLTILLFLFHVSHLI